LDLDSVTGRKFGVAFAVRAFRDSLPAQHPLKNLSVAQLILSFTWQNPGISFRYWQEQLQGRHMAFSQREHLMLRPVMASYFPEAEAVPGAPDHQVYRESRLTKSRKLRIRGLLRARSAASSEGQRKEIDRKIKRMEARIARSAPATASPLEVDPLDDSPEEVEEERVVVYMASSSDSEAADDELVIDTPSWERL
jgi:hypothetical protein